MITSLRLVDFKNFADETLRVGPFTVIVGANASGKSNIRDAFRFLHGIGRGYTLAEIMGGKYGEGGQREWKPIRGAPNEIVRIKSPSRPKMGDFSVHLELELDGQETSYSIEIRFNPSRPDGLRVLEEGFRVDSKASYSMEKNLHRGQLPLVIGDGQEQPRIGLSRGQPALTQLSKRPDLRPILLNLDPEIQKDLEPASALELVLGSMRFLELSPERMREPSVPGAAIMGDSGENLPSVLESICTDSQRKRTLISWLHELTPMDVQDFEFPRDPSGRVHLRIVEKNGRKVSAYSASDGTLRFLAMLAALLSPSPAGVYFFEEIDNGIHPSRLHLLIDLIERQTAKNGVQVITTTHSPEVLNLINDDSFENTSVVYRDEESAHAIIRPVAELPNARKLRRSRGLGRLHQGGWMEDMLAFEEAEGEDEA